MYFRAPAALTAHLCSCEFSFYTYMKAMRDGMRTLAAITPQPTGVGPPPPDGPSADPWREGTRNVVFMLYLALESARKSVEDLVEFKPELIERTITILISELEAYRFLCEQFPRASDIRHQRIRLRDTDYRNLEPKLCALVKAGLASEQTGDSATRSRQPPAVSQWRPAELLLPELHKRYEAAIAATGVQS